MADLKAFRATNNLYQKDISEFLGVSIGFISAIERGDSKLPAEQLAKLLANTNGWDTTYLTSEGNGGWTCSRRTRTCAGRSAASPSAA